MLYVVVTGVSSGLGEAFATVASDEQGSTVVGISRRGNPLLERRAAERGSTYADYRFDLSKPAGIQGFAPTLFQHLQDGRDNDILLINNAAVEGPLGRVGRIDCAELIDHFNINLSSAMILAGEFIRHTAGWLARRTIVNITSGAAQHPYDGMSAYCASKAGLDMFCRCAALEQRDSPNPVRVLGMAPGVLETPMQDRLRATSDEVFQSRERFVALKRDGKLASALDAARRILSIARGNSFENGDILDLRTLA